VPSRNLKYYRDRRTEWLIKLGGRCVECGSTDDLHLDHKDPSSKLLELGKQWALEKSVVDTEVEKCQILCSSCHRVKSTLERGQTPARGTHGTLSSYRYCRCSECKTAWNNHSKLYRRERKLRG
jgi:5-methylcytosine-specific restriction endonuclease McrA